MLDDIYYEGAALFSAAVTSTPVQVMILLLQILGILLSFALLGFIIYVLIKKDYVGDKRKDFKRIFDPTPRGAGGTLSSEWNSVRERLREGFADYSKLILDATALMQRFLAEAGYEGETIEDQLIHVTPAEIRNLGEVLSAWRKAQMLQENEDVTATFEEAQMVLGAYEAALVELGMLSR